MNLHQSLTWQNYASFFSVCHPLVHQSKLCKKDSIQTTDVNIKMSPSVYANRRANEPIAALVQDGRQRTLRNKTKTNQEHRVKIGNKLLQKDGRSLANNTLTHCFDQGKIQAVYCWVYDCHIQADW